MLELMMAALQFGARVYKVDGTEVGHIVGGFPQGDPAVPVWFGVLMTKAMKDSQLARRRTLQQEDTREEESTGEAEAREEEQAEDEERWRKLLDDMVVWRCSFR